MIEPGYSIGDEVYHAQVVIDSEHVTCPDCLGTKHWSCSLPNGEELSILCPTCTHGYETTGKIPSTGAAGHVQMLTIGSVRTDSHESPEKQISYMCQETGVGSGGVWYEPDLHPSREQAEAILPDMVRERMIALEESIARSCSRKRLDGPGSMVAYFRTQIRRAKKDIEAAERGLEREKNG